MDGEIVGGGGGGGGVGGGGGGGKKKGGGGGGWQDSTRGPRGGIKGGGVKTPHRVSIQSGPR